MASAREKAITKAWAKIPDDFFVKNYPKRLFKVGKTTKISSQIKKQAFIDKINSFTLTQAHKFLRETYGKRDSGLSESWKSSMRRHKLRNNKEDTAEEVLSMIERLNKGKNGRALKDEKKTMQKKEKRELTGVEGVR